MKNVFFRAEKKKRTVENIQAPIHSISSLDKTKKKRKSESKSPVPHCWLKVINRAQACATQFPKNPYHPRNPRNPDAQSALLNTKPRKRKIHGRPLLGGGSGWASIVTNPRRGGGGGGKRRRLPSFRPRRVHSRKSRAPHLSGARWCACAGTRGGGGGRSVYHYACTSLCTRQLVVDFFGLGLSMFVWFFEVTRYGFNCSAIRIIFHLKCIWVIETKSRSSMS